MRTEVIKVAGETGVEEAAARAAAALVQGKLVGFPTETVYGIAAIAAIPEAMEGLRDLKSRPRMPFSVHLGRAEEVERYVSEIPQAARRVINKAWPGPLTILLPTGGRLADMALQVAGLHDVLCWEDTIGLRCPRPAVTRQMLIASEHPVVATSANPAGQPSPRAPSKVLEYFDGRIDMLIDAGQTDLGRDSTIVKFGATGWDVVREGAVDRSTLAGLVRR